ncbi:MAG: DUF4157 domain-containing protein [Crocosphaera sp.]|nr:DUF4157 domain-containing protein [Crocosphaera sp.]
MEHRKLHQPTNKSESDIHPSKGWLQKQEKQETSEHEEDPTVVAGSGLPFNFLDVPVQKVENEIIRRSMNPQTWPYHVHQLQENPNPQQLDEGRVPNRTGLPDRLKTGVENLSGYSLDDVIVHYNSPKPLQLQALAYTQGTDIHVAPGQEKHLPHEAWHVVQQMQGRVKPTMQMKGVQINDDQGLEREADVMGGKIENPDNETLLCKTSKYQAKERIQKPITVQRNIEPGQADQQNWNAKHVPKRVKEWARNAQVIVREQYETSLTSLASNPTDQGDGVLAYLNGWNHKRFGGHWCILYRWAARRDGQGWFLKVKGIGRKNGQGNDYSLAD